MLKVNWLAKDKWDQTFLSDIIEELSGFSSDRDIIVVPGAEYHDRIDAVNKIIARHKKVLVVITSDEESLFDSDLLIHDDMIVYSQYPTLGKSYNVSFWLPIGYTPQAREYAKSKAVPNKTLDWSFSGQINIDSRRELVDVLKASSRANGFLLETAGFTQGLPPSEYVEIMARSKVAPSPHGIVVPEAFRTWEALELGAVPVPQGKDYHDILTPSAPFEYAETWNGLDSIIEGNVSSYPSYNNEAQSWWLQQKRRIKQQFIDDLGIKRNKITVMISTSPVITNPSIKTIKKVIKTVRWQLPDSEIIVMADGVRQEQASFNANYQEYLRRLLWWANKQKDITVIVYREHLHQLEMTRRTLEKVNTELILFVEHDMPFYERYIDWGGTIKLVESNKIKVMRYHFEATIPQPHDYLMIDKKPTIIDGVPLIRTAQWSQRPHLIKRDFYKELLTKWNSPRANAMIEDAIYGHIVDDILYNNKWDDYRIAIYAPDTPTGFCFAYHIDGRLGEEKYEDKQVF